MNPLKMLSFAAMSALMAMAFLGAASAMAGPTSLCTEEVKTTCKSEHLISHVHQTTLAGAKATLLNSISNVLCDALFLGEVTSKGGLSELLQILLEEPDVLLHYWMPLWVEGNFTYTNCVDEKPNSCTVTEVSVSSIIRVLRTKSEVGTVTGDGEVKVVCSGISCTYNGKELPGTAEGSSVSTEKNGSVEIIEKSVNKVKGLLCPSTAKLDITVTPLEPIYLAE